MNARLFAACAAAAMTIGAFGTAHAGVIFYDGFEMPMSSGITYGGTDSAGAYFGDGTGLQSNGSPFGYAPAPEGTQTAHIQGDGSFEEFVTGLVDGATYTLSFYDAARSGYAVDGVVVSYEGLAPDPVVTTTTPTSTGFQLVSTNFTYTGGSPEAVFTIAGTTAQTVGPDGSPSGDYNIAVDGFQIASAVPEPGVWAMMLAGVAMTGAGLRFNRKRSVAIAAA